jgi:hypothetical protein
MPPRRRRLAHLPQQTAGVIVSVRSSRLAVLLVGFGATTLVQCGDTAADDDPRGCASCSTASTPGGCVHAIEGAECCEGATRPDITQTVCPGVTCTDRYQCEHGHWYLDHDNCHFVSSSCRNRDSGAGDADARDDADASDGCVLANDTAGCCEGTEYRTPATTCGGTVACSILHYCRGGVLLWNPDDCSARSCSDGGVMDVVDAADSS